MARRTTHGAICPQCGSVNVVIETTRTRELERRPGERYSEKRQHCICRGRGCGHNWWRRTRVRETELRTAETAEAQRRREHRELRTENG